MKSEFVEKIIEDINKLEDICDNYIPEKSEYDYYIELPKGNVKIIRCKLIKEK